MWRGGRPKLQHAAGIQVGYTLLRCCLRLASLACWWQLPWCAGQYSRPATLTAKWCIKVNGICSAAAAALPICSGLTAQAFKADAQILGWSGTGLLTYAKRWVHGRAAAAGWTGSACRLQRVDGLLSSSACTLHVHLGYKQQAAIPNPHCAGTRRRGRSGRCRPPPR